MKKLILCFALLLAATTLHAQASNSNGPLGQMWPSDPPVGIGTQTSTGGPQSALHIHFKMSSPTTDTAMIRLSEGDTTTTNVFGLLGLMPPPYDKAYSSLSNGDDLILHEHSQGDLILTNYQSTSLSHPYGYIRMATTPSLGELPLTAPYVLDYERLTIAPNGNIGINIPPGSGIYSGLANPLDQVQIGGGVTPYPGNTWATGPITIYGGNQFENMPAWAGGTFHGDWRYVAFNKYQNHITGAGSRFSQSSSSQISFSDNSGGLLNFGCFPYDSSRGLTDFTHNLTFQMTGSEGYQFWYYQDSTLPYHHLFDCYLPGLTPWPMTRNPNGAFIHHTPVLITSDRTSTPSVDFQNLPVRPDMGDDTTWLLVINGPALAKEIFVDDSDWPDYVFEKSFQLKPIDEVENFIEQNHHLPDIPSKSTMKQSGIPVARTEVAITKQVEELTLYIIDQNKRIEKLESEIEELKNQKGK